jgi:hypothetical protein
MVTVPRRIAKIDQVQKPKIKDDLKYFFIQWEIGPFYKIWLLTDHDSKLKDKIKTA